MDAIGRIVAKARRDLADVPMEEAAFVEHLQTLEAASEAHAADLYLAFACARGNSAAHDRFERTCGPDIDRLLEDTELRQRARIRILIGEDTEGPRIAQYAGRGSLRGWVRVVARRMLFDQSDRERSRPDRAADPAVIEALQSVPLDPSSEWLRQRYREEVKAAMGAAFEALQPKQRRLLRGHLVERLNTDDLGALYGVHRTTAARWVEQARAQLVDRTHEELRRQLGAEDDTVRSLIALVRSTIDLSVVRLLSSNRDEPQ